MYSCLLIIINFKVPMQDTALDFLCGCVSGWVQVVVMQPFELIKVRLINQSCKNPYYNGIYDCFKKIRSEQGIMAFYKGSLSPFVGVGAQVAMMYGSNQLVKRTMVTFFGEQKQDDSQDDNLLTMQMIFIAGILTGTPSSLLVTPIDHTRILCQNQKGLDKSNKYHGSIDAGRQLLKKYGIKGLFHGFYPTLLRESLAMPFYFSSYEFGMRMLSDQNTTRAPMFAPFFVGGISGMISWLFTYPIDYIKTVVQSDPLENRKYKSAIHCAKVKYAQQGIKTFFKGLGITMLRSFPVSGIGFLSFQWMMKITGRKDQQKNQQQIY